VEGVTDLPPARPGPVPEPRPAPARLVPAPALAPARLLSTPVVVLWFGALLVWASGRTLDIVGLTLAFTTPGVSGTSVSVLLAAFGMSLLYSRRGFDALTRMPAVSAVVMALASALATVGVLALLLIGPDRPIGVVDLEVGFIVALTTAAASASTVVLIRPYVDPMVAHVWAGIAGAGIALPLMIAGVSPALVMLGAMGLGLADRMRGARFEREVNFRKQLEAEYAAQHGSDGRGIGVSGLPGMPPLPRAPRPTLPWSLRERRATLALGVATVVSIALVWTAGSAAAEAGLLVAGQGFALASIGAVPLIAQIAVLARVATQLRVQLAITGGMLVFGSVATLVAPIAQTAALAPNGTLDAVVISAISVQSLAIALVTGMIVHRTTARRTLAPALMLGATAAIAWWLVVLPTGGLVLAFAGVATTLAALRRKARN